LERGIAVRQGVRFLRAELPRMLAMPRAFCDAEAMSALPLKADMGAVSTH
jgi:hypothetical protein